jgi:hypothetical protein
MRWASLGMALCGLLGSSAASWSQELRASPACEGVSASGGGSASSYWNPPPLSTMVEEMRRPHPVKPFGGSDGWYVRPTVVMGTEPSASSLPKNWKGLPATEWRAVTPWFVVYPGEEFFTAPNTAVQIGGIQLWYFSKSNALWKLVASNDKPTWQGNYDSKGGWVRAEQVPAELRSCAGIFAPPQGQHAHGGLTKFPTPWGAPGGQPDIDALLVIVSHRLVRLRSDQPDDRAFSRYVVMAGADYYPNVNSRLADLNAPYVPGVGLGQFKLSTPEWQYASMFVQSRSADLKKLLDSVSPGTFRMP